MRVKRKTGWVGGCRNFDLMEERCVSLKGKKMGGRGTLMFSDKRRVMCKFKKIKMCGSKEKAWFIDWDGLCILYVCVGRELSL